jgi:hypothetical protein
MFMWSFVELQLQMAVISADLGVYICMCYVKIAFDRSGLLG